MTHLPGDVGPVAFMYLRPHLSGSWFDICDFVPQYFLGLPKRHAQSRHFDVLQSHDVILYSLESRRAKGDMGDEFISWIK